ncbi:MAG: hypothetical protein MJA27_29375 [Pseudanabaenales cyanobacterium]|nr:hypothetical protein [Pseudanabaenales cyanobacterium]
MEEAKGNVEGVQPSLKKVGAQTQASSKRISGFFQKVAKLEQQVEVVIKTAQRMLELNQLTEEQARQLVNNLVDTPFLKEELIVQAEQLLTKTIEQEGEKQIKLIQSEQQKIQAQVESGLLGQVDIFVKVAKLCAVLECQPADLFKAEELTNE